MNTQQQRINMLHTSTSYLVGCHTCGRAHYISELTYWRDVLLLDGTEQRFYFCNAECSTKAHKESYKVNQREIDKRAA